MADEEMTQETLKKKMMVSILKFLHEELTGGGYDAENSEGLEVAIQCLESIYKVNSNSLEEPPISTVYKSYLRTNVMLQPDPSEESKSEAENLKTLGNNAMSKQQFPEAISFYSRALELNPKNAIYYCNRAAAFSRISNHRAAIKDCETAIEIDATYSKAYGRLGIAYSGLENYKLAIEHYERALELDPKNESYMGNLQQAQKKLEEQQSAKSSSSGANPAGSFSGRELDSILESPQLMTFASHMLSDPSMVNMMRNYMSGSFNDERNMDAILEAGQRMAQFICQDRPRFLNELRQRMSNGGSRTNLDDPTNETAMEEDNPADDSSLGSNKKNPSNPP